MRDLGRVDYRAAFDYQRQLQREVIGARDQQRRSIGFLLLLEHDPPVITISRRPGARQHLVATNGELQAAGVMVETTDRGGDITYHGPGQLVVYPILDLNRLHLRLHSYMRFLEQIVIDVLDRWGIEGTRDEEATGVWVRQGPGTPVPGTASKICAMGVRVSRWVAMHGLALNVTTDLSHFDLIVPCGLAGRTVTSMHELLGERCPTMEQVKRAMMQQFARACQNTH